MTLFLPPQIGDFMVDIVLLGTLLLIPFAGYTLWRLKMPNFTEIDSLNSSIFEIKLELDDILKKQEQNQKKIDFMFKRILENDNHKRKGGS